MTRTNVYRDDRVHVLTGKCSTCIFRPGNLMRLDPGRVEGMVADCLRDQGVIPCHQTLGAGEAVCRGFFDVHKHDVGLLSVAERLDLIEWQEPPSKD